MRCPQTARVDRFPLAQRSANQLGCRRDVHLGEHHTAVPFDGADSDVHRHRDLLEVLRQLRDFALARRQARASCSIATARSVVTARAWRSLPSAARSRSPMVEGRWERGSAAFRRHRPRPMRAGWGLPHRARRRVCSQASRQLRGLRVVAYGLLPYAPLQNRILDCRDQVLNDRVLVAP